MSYDEWKSSRWGDIATLEYGKSLRSYKNGVGSIPVFGTNGPIGFADNALCNTAGVIIGRKGAYRGVHYSDVPFFVIDTAFYLKPISQCVFNMKWAYYELLTKDINSMDSGSAIPSTSRSDFYSLPVLLPSIGEQRVIADTLSSLDNKIELNNRINKTLEEMAQAIFKQWFVDFDFPDENGQPYKSSGGEMEESELGLIPKGWKVGVLGDIANNIRDGVASGNITNNTAYIGLEHMPRKCLALSNWDEKPELMSNKFKFNEGDILFGKLRPYFHKVVVASISGICSTDILVINVKEPRWYSFALMHLFAEIFIDYTSAVSTGTKMPRTNWSDMARYQIIMPSFTLVDQFEDLIQPSLWAIKKNVLENRSLAKTRDTLLPKLMSGEIRVPIKEAAR